MPTSKRVSAHEPPLFSLLDGASAADRADRDAQVARRHQPGSACSFPSVCPGQSPETVRAFLVQAGKTLGS